MPVVEHLQKKLLERDIVHCGETPVQVLKKKNGKYLRKNPTCDCTVQVLVASHPSYFTIFTRCGCWPHLRRKFIEAISKKTGTDEPLTNAEIGRDYCYQLFEIERDLKPLSSRS